MLAAAFALALAIRQKSITRSTITLISLAATIGCGSFLFHTMPSFQTMWLDIIPILLFQIFFLWLITRKLLSSNIYLAAGMVVIVVGSSCALLPFQKPLNGSLFYIPSLVAMAAYGFLWAKRSQTEPYLLSGAAYFFAIAIIARSSDWAVPWPLGTHFLWHLLNGVVVYTAIRTWIVASSDPSPIR